MLHYEELRKSPNLLKRFNTLPALPSCAAKPNGADPASKRGETPGRYPDLLAAIKYALRHGVGPGNAGPLCFYAVRASPLSRIVYAHLSAKLILLLRGARP